MHVEHRFLFNFSAAYSGGGYKRLHAYARWFNAHGGAWFTIHPRCASLRDEFPNNRYFIIAQSHFKRLYDDRGYLDDIVRQIGQPELYFAYGVPLYRRWGQVNWSHLSNVLLLGTQGVSVSIADRLKFRLLGRRTLRGFDRADVISAESRHSLELVRATGHAKVFLSVNGSDDELASLHSGHSQNDDNIATVVGTYSYKALVESFAVFTRLKQTNPKLTLQIIGDAEHIPSDLRGRMDITATGTLTQAEVIDQLRRSRFFISTTQVENSYNSASEGIFFAAESYISDIGPHRELLADERYTRLSLPGAQYPLLHVRRAELRGSNLKSWHEIITDMIACARPLAELNLARADTPQPLFARLTPLSPAAPK